MKKFPLLPFTSLFAILAVALLGGCATVQTAADRDDDREDGREVSSVSVPPKVLSAAKARVPGFVLTDADLVGHNGAPVYQLEGNAGGNDYDIDVTPGGRVLRVDR